MTQPNTITALAPEPEPLDPAWSEATVAGILADARPTTTRRRKAPRRLLVGIAAAALSLGTATAVATGGATDVVKNVLTDFQQQPNTSGNDIGVLHDPELVAQFPIERGIFAVWIATSSEGAVCYAMSDGQWDGEGIPTREELGDYGCGGTIWTGPDTPPGELTRPEQLGGFFKDDEPLLYGVSPYPDAVSVRVQADGVDRTLPVRSDSHGYGAALPEAGGVPAVRLTFLDSDGAVLGTKRWVAPVG